MTPQEVQSNLKAHETLCKDRWEQIRDSVNRLWWVVLVSAGALISGQAWLLAEIVTGGLRK